MRVRLPFRVSVGCSLVAAFREYEPAMRYAQSLEWSEVHVYRGSRYHGNGIIGQFHKGKPTPEFAHTLGTF